MIAHHTDHNTQLLIGVSSVLNEAAVCTALDRARPLWAPVTISEFPERRCAVKHHCVFFLEWWVSCCCYLSSSSSSFQSLMWFAELPKRPFLGVLAFFENCRAKCSLTKVPAKKDLTDNLSHFSEAKAGGGGVAEQERKGRGRRGRESGGGGRRRNVGQVAPRPSRRLMRTALAMPRGLMPKWL